MGDDKRHERDDAPVRKPAEAFEDPDIGTGSVTFDSRGRFRSATVNPAGKGDLEYEREGTKSGPTTDYRNPQVKVDAKRVFNVEPSGDLDSMDNRPAAAQANQAALGFLRQELDTLEHAVTTEDIVRQITSVYAMANNLVHGHESWEPGLGAEFTAWVPYEVSSGAYTEYVAARDAVRQAGLAVYEAAGAWWSSHGDKRFITAQDANLAQALDGIGAALRGAIDTAHHAIGEANGQALQLLRQSIDDLDAASDPETIVRYVPTVYAMVDHLLHGDHGGGALQEEVREWIDVTPNSAAGTAAKEPIVAAARAFWDAANQRAQWYPCHALVGWDDPPLGDLLQAGHTARTAIAAH